MKFRLNLSIRVFCSLALLFLALSGLELSPQQVSARGEKKLPALDSQYGQLPLSFEPNRGQADSRAQYIARGQGYSISLLPDGAWLNLRIAEQNAGRTELASARPSFSSRSVRLKLMFVGAKSSSPNAGKKLAATSNYLTGREARNWLTGVPNFAEVSYRAIYPGIDLLYRGNQRQLEYDFVVAPGADPGRIKVAFEGAESVRLNERGELALHIGGAEVIQPKPVVYQEIDGQRRLVHAEYTLHRQQVGFRIGKYDPGKPLVIDPVLAYSKLFGGSGTDQIWGLAVDAAGNAYIAGDTASDFLAPSPIQTGRAALADAFVAKLSPDGSTLLQATYLGGSGNDSALGVRVDGAGSIYLTGLTYSTDFPVTANAAQRSLAGVSDAFLAKINVNGSALTYSTYLGGASFDVGTGLDVDAVGNAYVTGRTDSTGFALPGAVNSKSGVSLSKTVNGTSDWTPSAAGLERSTVRSLAIDPANRNTIYAGTDNGIFKTTDGGNSWQLTGTGGGNATQPSVAALAIDSAAPATLYAATANGILKSTDGGNTYQAKTGTGLVNTLAINPASPRTIYAGGVGAIKSTDGGESWTPVTRLSSVSVNKIVIDPSSPATIYAATSAGIFKTVNDGELWNPVNLGISPNPFGTPPPIISLEIANASPQTLFAGVQNGLFKTANGGDLWALSRDGLTTISGGLVLGLTPNAVAVDPGNSLLVYAGTSAGVYKSMDGGANWQRSSAGLKSLPVNALAIDRTNPATIYAALLSGGDAFVAKVNPSGTALGYLRFVGGDEFDEGSAIAIDAGGNAFITGRTNSTNFPTLNPLQLSAGGLGDAFVTKLNAAGAVSFSTYLGGNRPDQGLGIAIGADGSAYLTGFTSSADFPLVNALKSTITGVSPDAFVARLKGDGSGFEFSTFLGGSSSEAGYAIAVDGAGNALVAGITFSGDFPTLLAPQAVGNGAPDAFVAKLSGNGVQLLFSTYLGGSGGDQATGVATDAAGNVYVAGITNSFNFPVVPQSNQMPGVNGFIVKYSSAPDLVLTMTDSPDPVALGNDLTYTLTLTNRGEIPATGVKLSDTLPAGATLVSASVNQGTCAGTSTINCELGMLNVGAIVTVTIVIKPPAVRTITNTAVVAANELELTAANNRAEQTTTVDFADIAVTVAELNKTVKIGATAGYAIKVSNRSGAAATNVTVMDMLPSQLTFASCSSADGGVCGSTGNTRTITFPALAVGETKHAVILAAVNASVADGVTISNSVTASQALVDSDPANNAATATITAVTNPLRVSNNGRIVFASTSLTTVENTGGRYQSFPFVAFLPVYSPNGTKIAFIGAPAEDSNTLSLGVLNLDNGGYTRLTSNYQFIRPTWSPDSSRLVFVRSGKEVWVINRDGTGEAKLFTAAGDISDPDWSPDGTRLAYVRSGNIYAANLDGGNETRLTNYLGNESTPRWSPDGSQLLFMREQPAIYRVNADSSDPQRLFNEASQAVNANWSPDGTKIVYELNERLFSVNLDGTNLLSLTPSRIARQPHWQPLPTATPLVPQPGPKTYSISGRLALNDGAPARAEVTLTGTRRGKVQTDADGNYDFGNLPEGAQATVTPASVDYTFEPAGRSFDNLRRNQTLNFAAAPTNFSVTGRVTDPSGAPIERVEIQLLANISYAGPLVVATNRDGGFSFSGLPVRGTYVFRPRAGFVTSFEPATFTISPNVVSRVINFVGVRKTVGISGKVIDADGNPIVGATVAAAGSGAMVAMTDAGGNYTLPNLVGGLDYTLSASKSGATFVPISFPISRLDGTRTVNFFAGASQVAVASAASFSPRPVAPDSIVAAFGANFSTETQVATTLPLPTSLADTSVTIQDSNFVERAASLFFVSPGQINLLIPAGTAEGNALMLVKNKNRTVAAGILGVVQLAPSLFTANASGRGVPAALVYRQLVTNVVYEPVSRFDAARREHVPIPIDIGPEIAPQPLLILYGTGLRAAAGGNPLEIFADIGGVRAIIYGLAAQGTFAGLDQVNVELPRSLIGRGEVDLVLTINGRATNTVRVAFK